MIHALTIAWAAAAALVLTALGTSGWSQRKTQSIVLILLATALQTCLAYYALGSYGVNLLLSLVRE